MVYSFSSDNSDNNVQLYKYNNLTFSIVEYFKQIRFFPEQRNPQAEKNGLFEAIF
jgi:hypothetical protein